jgi:hypothetical protein
MAWQHMAEIAEMENISGDQKLVLFSLATRACLECGLVWAGLDYLTRKSRRSETTVSAALRELKYTGLVTVHAYSRGGRGKATEYILLPQAFAYASAPCVACQERRQTPRAARGMTTPKLPATRGVSGGETPKPPATRAGNPPPRDPHSVINTILLGAARQSDPSASPPGSASPRSSEPSPGEPITSENERRAATEALESLGISTPQFVPTTGHSAKPDAFTALLEAEAREPDQETEHPPEADAPGG